LLDEGRARIKVINNETNDTIDEKVAV